MITQGPFAPLGVRSRERTVEEPSSARLGPMEKIYLLWLAGGSCDGCSVAVVGATNPPVEHLMQGIVPGLPRLELLHTALSVEMGNEYIETLAMAARNELDAPFVLVWEGSVFEEELAGDGFFYKLGDGDGDNATTSTEWLGRLAPNAAAVIAIGSCAAWGGIPSSHGNDTGSKAVMDHLGVDYRSAFGVPVVNIPGCSPIGDNFMETAAAVLLFLQGLAPLPDFDELGRPAWLFSETVHRHCPRAGYYEEGVFAEHYGEHECLVELGCWGPVVQCNIAERGIVNGTGGCMQMGGICIGCTMPGFPDKFSPLYSTPPGSLLSSNTSRVFGGFIRRIRRITMVDKNASARWEGQDAPSGFARYRSKPGSGVKLIHRAYRAFQQSKIGG